MGVNSLLSIFTLDQQEGAELDTMNRVCVLLLACLIFASCVVPSDDARRASYATNRQAFKGDPRNVGAATYHLLSVETDFKSISVDPQTGRISGAYSEDRRFKKGLCVGIDASGYLLTAAHVVDKFCYVIGDFGGQWGVRRARVVKGPPGGTAASDFALLKVDAGIHSLPYATDVAPGQLVFAVVFVMIEDTGGRLDFAAGKIKSVEPGPSGYPAAVIDTTVPLRAGDSGGPLVDVDGALVGITQGWQLRGNLVSWQYRRLTCRPERKVLEAMMTADRAMRN